MLTVDTFKSGHLEQVLPKRHYVATVDPSVTCAINSNRKLRSLESRVHADACMLARAAAETLVLVVARSNDEQPLESQRFL